METEIEEEKQQAIIDAYTSRIINGYQDDSSELLMLLSDRLKLMAQGELDSRVTDAFHSLLDNAIDAPFEKRHEPLNRFIIDTIYSKAESLAQADRVVQPVRKGSGLVAAWRDY